MGASEKVGLPVKPHNDLTNTVQADLFVTELLTSSMNQLRKNWDVEHVYEKAMGPLRDYAHEDYLALLREAPVLRRSTASAKKRADNVEVLRLLDMEI